MFDSAVLKEVGKNRTYNGKINDNHPRIKIYSARYRQIVKDEGADQTDKHGDTYLQRGDRSNIHLRDSLLTEDKESCKTQSVKECKSFSGTKGKGARIAAEKKQSDYSNKLQGKAFPLVGSAKNNGGKQRSEKNGQGHDKAYIGGCSQVQSQIAGNIGSGAAQGGRHPDSPADVLKLTCNFPTSPQKKKEEGQGKAKREKPEWSNGVISSFS